MKFDTGRVTIHVDRSGLLHRKDGPARVWNDGWAEEWWLNGRRHRDTGPALICRNGVKIWYTHGKFIKNAGPATTPWIDPHDGWTYWFADDDNMLHCKPPEKDEEAETS